jgi:hypothetical protein
MAPVRDRGLTPPLAKGQPQPTHSRQADVPGGARRPDNKRRALPSANPHRLPEPSAPSVPGVHTERRDAEKAIRHRPEVSHAPRHS